MVEDQQSYHRAANAALVGLLVQIALCAVMILASLAARSPALYAVAFYLIGGLPIWIILLVLYHQHRLERAEALETEQLARGDAQTGALFEEHGDDLQIARRRLNGLYKFGLPTVAVIVAIYLIALGGFLFFRAYSTYTYDAQSFMSTAYMGDVNPIGPMVVSLIVAFLAFIVARYEAGMTKIEQWQVLRGGAGYLMGNFVAALLAAIGLAFLIFDSRMLLAALGLAMPALMVVLGLEVFLAFLLNAYRPRRPGEAIRPAFDSRMLGLLATPKSLAKALSDAINYQFGFEVSRSWFYQLLGRAITPLIVFAIVVLVAVSSIVMVQPYEQAVVLRFGRIIDGQTPLDPGPHLKWPWPIESVEKYPVGRVQEISLGSAPQGLDPNVAILWTKPHILGGGKEEYLVTAPTPLSFGSGDDAGSQSSGAADAARTPGMSLIGMQVVVQYRISNLMNYVRVFNEPATMLSRISESQLNRFLVTQDIDTLIGPGRIGAGDRLRKMIQTEADASHLGLEVVFAGFAGVHPPSDKEVANAFQTQISALQDRQKTIEDGRRDAIETLAKVAGSRAQALAIKKVIEELQASQQQLEKLKADPTVKPQDIEAKDREIKIKEASVEDLVAHASGEAAKMIFEARAYRWDRAISEQARAGRFEAELQAYRQSPELYRARRYLEVLSEGMADGRKYIVASDNVQTPLYRIDLTDSQSALDSIMKNK